jgi:RNA polymerase-binding transcription factor DksA
LRFCEDCDAEIPQARREALPGVRRCVACQAAADASDARAHAGYNRRGSKDSQLS